MTLFSQMKHFDRFTNKIPEEHQFESSPYLGQTILATRDHEWKLTRKAMTSVFSPANLKKLSVVMAEQVEQYMNEIKVLANSGQEFNFQEFSQRLTLSVLTRSSFGTDSGALITSLIELEHFQKSNLHKLIFILHICFPWLHPIRRLYEQAINYLGLTSIRALKNVTRAILKERKKSKDSFHYDLIEAMIASDMTDEQIIANSLLFFVGGFETSSNALTYVVHSLVNYPDVQERVREEVIGLLGDDSQLDFNKVDELKYLDRVIRETLRMYPPLIKASTRMCKADLDHEVLTIPAGAMVQLATYHMHNDPDIWDEPDKFNPDRFLNLTEDQKSCWQPFGAGPRNCLGMRFAFTQIKITVAKILMKHQLISGPNTERGRLSTKCRTFALCPKNSVFIKVINN